MFLNLPKVDSEMIKKEKKTKKVGPPVRRREVHYNSHLKIKMQYKLINKQLNLLKFSWRILFIYRGFHEKGTLSYLCALGIDRCSPLNECTLQVPFI